MNPAEFNNIAQSEREFWWYRAMREILFRVLDRPPRSKRTALPRGAAVLEAGCGTGYMSKMLAERYGWRMIPLDIAPEGLQFAKNYGLTRLVEGDMTALPFAHAAFDGLFSLDVVAHLERGREPSAFAEFARVLKPGGLLVMRASALDILKSRHSDFAHEKQRFTRDRLIRTAESAGFQVEQVSYFNSLLLPVSLFKFRVWEPLTGAPAASGVTPVAPWLDRILYSALSSEAGWLAQGRGFPAGQSLLLVATRR